VFVSKIGNYHILPKLGHFGVIWTLAEFSKIPNNACSSDIGEVDFERKRANSIIENMVYFRAVISYKKQRPAILITSLYVPYLYFILVF
jgi:hypothetical protein